MRPILTLQDVLTRLMFFIGVGALAAIVLIYAFEVVSRYAFGAPTLWASDFVSFLLLITVFSTAPWLTTYGVANSGLYFLRLAFGQALSETDSQPEVTHG